MSSGFHRDWTSRRCFNSRSVLIVPFSAFNCIGYVQIAQIIMFNQCSFQTFSLSSVGDSRKNPTPALKPAKVSPSAKSNLLCLAMTAYFLCLVSIGNSREACLIICASKLPQLGVWYKLALANLHSGWGGMATFNYAASNLC